MRYDKGLFNDKELIDKLWLITAKERKEVEK